MDELNPQTPVDGDSEGAVPLTNYGAVLVSWWREIVLGSCLVAIGCGTLMLAVRTLLPRYEASSDITILRVTSNVAVDKQFSTGATTDEQAFWRRRGGHQERIDRRAALVGLVRSGNVARAVAERLSGRLGKKNVSAARLLEKIDAELVTIGTLSMRNSSDLIRITATADSPEEVALIADVWAEEYVDDANRLYRYTPANQLDLIMAEMKRTQESYEVAQKELQTFIINSNIDKLNSLLLTKQEAVNHLHSVERNMFKRALFSIEKDLERQSDSVGLYVTSERDKLSENYQRQRKLKNILARVKDLRVQVEKGAQESIPTNMLPIMLLKTAIYNSDTSLVKTLEISLDDIPSLSKTNFLAELDTLTSILENRIQSIGSIIQKDSQLLLIPRNLDSQNRPASPSSNYAGSANGRLLEAGLQKKIETVVKEEGSAFIFDQAIDQLETQIQRLKAEIETTNTTRETLVENRDVVRTALGILKNEVIELKLAMAASTSEVRVASQALVPEYPAYPSVLLVACLGWVAGLPAVVCLVFSLNFRGIPPLLEKRGATSPGRTRDLR